MRHSLTFLMAVVWAASPGALSAQSVDDLVGRTVTGSEVGDWTVETSHSWCVLNSFDPKCMMVQLRRRQMVAIALTRPTRWTATGGVAAETIYRIFPVKIPPEVRLAECRDINGRPAVLGWLNRRNNTATIFTTNGRTLLRTSLRYGSDEPCEIGQD